MKNTMGQFIAALRKANGMTQQEVAERLNVSNKAVSRWERDESAPDLSVIPALAELFGVTCDELLRGERLRAEEPPERPMRAALNHAVATFRSRVMLAVAGAAVGFICMLGIAYGFYRPGIGFAVLMLFCVAAWAVLALAINRMKEIKEAPGLPESSVPDGALVRYGYPGLFAPLVAIVLSLPLILVDYGGFRAVLSAGDYLGFWVVLVPFLVYAFLRLKPWFERLFLGRHRSFCPAAVTRVSLVQWALCATATGLLWYCPHRDDPAGTVGTWLGLLCLCANLALFLLFFLRRKETRRQYLFPGLRNLAFTLPVLVAAQARSVGYTYFGEPSETTLFHRYETWEPQLLLLGAAGIVLLISLFGIADHFYQKRNPIDK